ncbi:hypothetical protein SLE2022_156940 [Rubroshorea leprosula]
MEKPFCNPQLVLKMAGEQIRSVIVVAFLLFLCLNNMISETDAQYPLRGLKMGGMKGSSYGRLSFENIKESGPSPRGPGHKRRSAPHGDGRQDPGPSREVGLGQDELNGRHH